MLDVLMVLDTRHARRFAPYRSVVPLPDDEIRRVAPRGLF